MARVLIVTSSYPAYPGDPSGHFIQTEARLSQRAGNRVIVLAPATPDDRAAEDGVSVVRVAAGDAFGWPGVSTRLCERPARVFDVARFVRLARRAVSELGAFDEVVAHWILPSGWPIAAAASGRVEVVAHGSDVRLVERLPGPARRALARSLLARGARFRFVSRELEVRFVRATTDAVLARSRVEPSPIDVDGVPARAEARARLGLGAESVAVVVGRLTRGKAPARAGRIAAVHAHRVVFVGDGPLEATLRRDLPDAVFTGKLGRHDALTWIAAADVLVSASPAEGSPTVVREARALGTPVVAVPAGDIAERAAHDPGIRLVSADGLLAKPRHQLDEVTGPGARIELG